MDSLVGFRFKPTDEEIIHLLKKKRLDPDFSVNTVREIDIYKFQPWELPGLSRIQPKEEVWYFYCKPFKYGNGKRVHRRTKTGYWKITGKGSNMKAKKTGQVIGTKKILPFCDSGASKKGKSEWVIHEIAVEDDDPLYKEDFVICCLQRKRKTKLGISTSSDDRSSQDLASVFSVDATEDIFSESAIPLDQLMVSDRNHVVENICSMSNNMISHSRNHVAGNASVESILPPNQQSVVDRNHVAEDTMLVSLPRGHLIPCSINHVAENTSLATNQPLVAAKTSMLESILPANQHLVSNGNHVAENSSKKTQVVPNDNLELPRLPNQHSVPSSTNIVESTVEAEPRPFAEFNPHGSYDGLNNTPFSALQSPDKLSYYNDSSYGCDILNSPFYTEWVDGLINLPRDFQNESSHEETGQAFTPDSNSSKSDECSREATGQTFSPNFDSSASDGGVYVRNSSDMDTETFNAWVNGVFENDITQVNELSENSYYLSSIC